MAENIITSEVASTSSPLNPSSRIICRVCQKQFSQYTCPRCNTRYCSLLCYKSHSLRCTESFMRDNVMEELRQQQPDDGSKQKMLEILRRFHSEEEIDSMEEDETESDILSEETIQKILSGHQISVDDLSAEERKCFERAMASGELSKLIKPWEPWWMKTYAKFISLSQDGTRLVQPHINQDPVVSSQDDVESDQLHDIPPGPESPLPSVRKLSSAEPSPLLPIHLVDIIYSYCFTLRRYNGDWESDPIESAMALFSISSVLSQVGQPETVSGALAHCVEQTCSPAFKHMGGSQFGLALIDDVINILYLGTEALVCLLCDLQRLIQAAERDLKLEKPGKSKRLDTRSKLKFTERKVYFIMCWVHDQPGEAWSSLAAVVNAEKKSVMEDEGKEKGVVRMEKKVEKEGKALIREID